MIIENWSSVKGKLAVWHQVQTALHSTILLTANNPKCILHVHEVIIDIIDCLKTIIFFYIINNCKIVNAVCMANNK